MTRFNELAMMISMFALIAVGAIGAADVSVQRMRQRPKPTVEWPDMAWYEWIFGLPIIMRKGCVYWAAWFIADPLPIASVSGALVACGACVLLWAMRRAAARLQSIAKSLMIVGAFGLLLAWMVPAGCTVPPGSTPERNAIAGIMANGMRGLLASIRAYDAVIEAALSRLTGSASNAIDAEIIRKTGMLASSRTLVDSLVFVILAGFFSAMVLPFNRWAARAAWRSWIVRPPLVLLAGVGVVPPVLAMLAAGAGAWLMPDRVLLFWLGGIVTALAGTAYLALAPLEAAAGPKALIAETS